MSASVKVIIPARYGSSRLPGKPLLDICGKPMFWHVYQRAVEAGIHPDDILIATDDERIIREANKFGICSVMTSAKHTSGTDRLNEVAQNLNWHDDVLVINLQGDEPLIPSMLIKQLVEFSIDKNCFDITTVVSPISSTHDLDNPNIVKVAMGEDGRAVYFSRLPIPFNRDKEPECMSSYRHIGIYAYSVKNLRLFCQYPESLLERVEKLEQLRALGNGLSIGVTIVDNAPPHGVDTEQDYINIRLKMEQ